MQRFLLIVYTALLTKYEVKDTQVKLFINDHQQPSLAVNDLKHVANVSGAIGLWVDRNRSMFF